MKAWLQLSVGTMCLLIVGAGAWLAANGEGTWAASDPVQGCPGGIFTRKAAVFEALTICATQKVPGDKLRHAANVAAQWIDNDQDGAADEPRVLAALQSRPAFVYMSEMGMNAIGMIRVFSAEKKLGALGQDLGAHETNPSEGRDAAQEEIHHILMNAGWIPAFPDLFSDIPNRNSVLYRQWELAEQNGYYAYGDPTCDAACKVTEFVYLVAAAYLGSAADLDSDEMRIKTRAELREKLPQLVALFESKAYSYPLTIWPDGDYPHQNNIQVSD